MRTTHVGSTHSNATIAIAALALAIALALVAASSAHSVPSGPDCLLTNTGGSLDDSLCGTSAADVMSGGAGNDSMFGRAGNDTMNGDSGKDIVRGEAGNDILVGGSGANDSLVGGSGNDQLRFRDAELDSFAPFTDCGDGTDSISMDLVDFAVLGIFAFGSCESVTVGAVNEGPNVVISRQTPKIQDNGKVPVRLSCPDSLAAPCAGTLQLGSSEQRQGKQKAYSLAPGASHKVTARLSQKDRRKLSQGGKLTAAAASIEQGEFGDKTTVQTLELRGKRHT